MDIKKLRQDRIDALNRAKAISAAAAALGRDMNDEEGMKYDAEMAAVASLDKNISRAEQLLEAERTAPAVDAFAGASELEKKGFASLGEQLVAVAQFGRTKGRRADSRLFALSGQNETVDSDGGFLIQPEFAPDLLTRAFNAGIITSRCRTRPMGGPRLIINGLVDDNRVGGPAGAGIIVGRTAEIADLNLSKLKFRRVELNANKLIGAYVATDDVLEDAPALQAEINDYFPDAFSWRMDNEALNGTGSGQFLGILTSGAKVTTPKQAAQAAGTIVTQNILDMVTRLWIKSRANAAFFVGPDVEAVLMTLTIPGPQGTAVALYTPPGVAGNNSKYGVMLGIPVILIEQTAALGTEGDIILADFSQYIIGERNGLKFASSIHVEFLTDQQVFRWTLRNDGQPLWDKPVTQNNSANKVSPFVTLQTRS